MYARVQVVPEVPTTDADAVPERVMETISGHPGFQGAWMMRQLTARGGVLVTLWDTREDAELAPQRTAAAHGPRPFALSHDAVYDVRAAERGAAAEQDPAFTQLTWFDGPRSAAHAKASERAGRDRIWPAVRDLPGLVRAYYLTGADNAALSVVLSTDAHDLDVAQQRIMATRLLPGEEAALLTGPDRIDICAVVAARTAPVSARGAW